ncbi:hypothetical protein PESP_b0220 [Pseudoalteromonas espejiana DSM 9414]|nr:hypothetical protein PESP_b0220 [Pseudoalteromonas espejiana DSM 9414]
MPVYALQLAILQLGVKKIHFYKSFFTTKHEPINCQFKNK